MGGRGREIDVCVVIRSPVPETLLKKRKAIDLAKAKAASHRVANKKRNQKKRQEIFIRAEKYVREYKKVRAASQGRVGAVWGSVPRRWGRGCAAALHIARWRIACRCARMGGVQCVRTGRFVVGCLQMCRLSAMRAYTVCLWLRAALR